MKPHDDDITRRTFVEATVAAASLYGAIAEAAPATTTPTANYSLTINGQHHDLQLEPRVTLLDLLREGLHLTGTKKGCDHGPMRRLHGSGGWRAREFVPYSRGHSGTGSTSPPSKALLLARRCHPLQAAFIEYDGISMRILHIRPNLLGCRDASREAQAGMPSAVTLTAQ